MLTKPSNWDDLRTKEGTVCTYRVLVGDDVYTSLEDIEDDSLKISRTLFTAGNLIGNTPCFTLECCLRLAGRGIPRGAEVKAQVALKNGDMVTDFIPLGTFKVYRRQSYSDGWVKLTCRDKMQMANQGFFQKEVVDSEWPKSMITVLRESAAQVGVEIDPRTVINEGDAWIVTPPVGQSIRSVWSAIAAAHGGNFYITPEDRLLLVVPRMTEDSEIELECSMDGYELLGDGIEINQVTLKINSEAGFSSGEPGVNNIEANCPYANQVIADYVKGVLTGILYHPLSASDLWIDPAMEVHDSCWVGGSNKTLTTWSRLDTAYRLICSAKGEAESMSEPDSEYGFEDTPINQLRAQSKQFAIDAVEGMTQEEVFNKLTNNGEAQGIYIQDGKLYLNASYIQLGTILANLIKAGVLQSNNGNFRLNLDTGEVVIGGYATSQDLNNLGGMVTQQEDALEVVKKDLITIQTESGDLRLTVQGLMDNGVSKVITSTGYTFKEDGLRIQKTGQEMFNLLDHTGMYVTRAGETILQANNEGVVATDVKVRNYLIVGDHSRFEDYNDSIDSRRTACFYVEQSEEVYYGLR